MRSGKKFHMAGNVKSGLPKSIPEEVIDVLKNNFQSFLLVIDSGESGESVHCVGDFSFSDEKTIWTMSGAANRAFANVFEQLGYKLEQEELS